MTENWLQRTVDAPNILEELVERFGTERINEIERSDTYKDAQAVMALALNEALNKTRLSRGKRRKAGTEMLADLMTGTISAFLLGWKACEADQADQIDKEMMECILGEADAQ